MHACAAISFILCWTKYMSISEIILSGEVYKKYNRLVTEENHTLNKPAVDNFDGLHDITNEDISKLFVSIKTHQTRELYEELEKHKLRDDWEEHIFITGPAVRAVFSNNEFPTKQQYTVHCVSSDLRMEDVLDIKDSNKFTVCKKRYNSIGQVLLPETYLRRVGIFMRNLYVTTMFIVEYHKNLWVLTDNNVDPVFNLPADILDIYDVTKNRVRDQWSCVELADIDTLLKLNQREIPRTLQNGRTLIEYALKLYCEETHPIIRHHRKNIALFLNNFEYARPAYLYAKQLEIDKKDKDLFQKLSSASNSLGIQYDFDYLPVSIEDINMYILKCLINRDDDVDFLTFIKNIDYLKIIQKKKPVAKKIADLAIQSNSTKIQKLLICGNLIPENCQYYLILMSENLNLLDDIEFQFSADIAMNYFEDVVRNGLIRSFYYLWKLDNSIVQASESVLHICEDRNQSADMIRLIVKIKPELLNVQNDRGKTPLIVFSEKKYTDNILLLIELGADLSCIDNDGDTFLHKLCKNGSSDIVKMIYKRCGDIIDIQNNQMETPIISCCQKSYEDIYYILKVVMLIQT